MSRSFTLLLAFATAVLAIPSPVVPDPNGAKNVGNGQGLQFITGGCLSTADCSQAVVQSCCAFISGGGSTGICSGIDVGDVNGKAGCGFGDAGSTSSARVAAVAATTAAAAASATSATSGQCTVNTVDASLPGSQNVGQSSAAQFITGQCFSAADCASGCCVAQASGIALCKARLVTEQAGLSCAATCAGASTNKAVSTMAAAAVVASSSSSSSASGQCTVSTVDASLPGSQNVGQSSAAQFITGQCFSAADCASGCCVAQASGIALCKARLVTEQAGLSCAATCSGASNKAASTTTAKSTAAATTAATVGQAGSAQCTVNQGLAGSQNVGKGTASQFITGQCFRPADCASGCCVSQASGAALCKARLVTEEAGQSCDFSCA